MKVVTIKTDTLFETSEIKLVGKHKVETKDIDATFDTYYKEIGCECVEIAERHINGTPYAIICDEDGLLGNNAITTVRSKRGGDCVVGNVIICRSKRGREIGLTDAEVAQVIGALDDNNNLEVD